jgi:hypothetical protein
VIEHQRLSGLEEGRALYSPNFVSPSHRLRGGESKPAAGVGWRLGAGRGWNRIHRDISEAFRARRGRPAARRLVEHSIVCGSLGDRYGRERMAMEQSSVMGSRPSASVCDASGARRPMEVRLNTSCSLKMPRPSRHSQWADQPVPPNRASVTRRPA